jgi:hypothetical protein
MVVENIDSGFELDEEIFTIRTKPDLVRHAAQRGGQAGVAKDAVKVLGRLSGLRCGEGTTG